MSTCYTRYAKNGMRYVHCSQEKKMSHVGLQLSNKLFEQVVEQVKREGFKKHSRVVARKMLRSGKGISNYSKTTGKLKRGR